MPFIIIFNIIVCVVILGVLLTIIGCSIASKDNKKPSDKQEIVQLKIDKVRNIAYLVFVCVLVLMIVVNLIF